MKSRFARFLGGLVFLSLLMAAAAPLRAEWIFAHGTAAAIQQNTAAAIVSSDYLGWGFDVKLKKNSFA
jgi:hypothetical protein